MDLTVVTYGGGEIHHNIFNAIAMLLNAKRGGYFQPFIIIIFSLVFFVNSKAHSSS